MGEPVLGIELDKLLVAEVVVVTGSGAENDSGAPLVTSATSMIDSVGDPWAHRAPDQVLCDRARCWLLRTEVDRFGMLGPFQFHIKNKF